MPPVLKAKLAVAVLIGIFLIPIGQSTLRGITHVLTCREQVEAPFQVILTDGQPIVTGASVLSAEESGQLCGGLSVDMSVSLVEGEVQVTVPIENHTDADWFGTVQLQAAGVRVPIDLGRVEAGQRVEETIVLRLPEGTVEFDGSLLIGP